MICQFAVTFLLLGCGLFDRSVEGRTSKELLITLPNGSELSGRALQSHDGRPFKAYMGIPYAQPPLGDLRFKVSLRFFKRFEFLLNILNSFICVQNPLPAKPWKGILDATKSSQQCIQHNQFIRGLPLDGSEDCLYLNVFVPHSVSKPLPQV